MYPREELAALRQRKMVLQARIAVRRWETAEAAIELSRPLAIVDRGIDTWRRISPLIKVLAVPVGLMLARLLKARRTAAGRSGGIFALLLGALPAILRGMKFAQQMRAAHAARARAERNGHDEERPDDDGIKTSDASDAADERSV